MGTVGKRPEPKQLERLADLMLYEELHDTHPDKVVREEYPIMSNHQLSRRHSDEVSMKVAEEYGVDQRNYKPPVRRKHMRKETWQIDMDAKSRNEDKRKVQSLITLRKYANWLLLLEREQNVKVLEDDGGRTLYNKGKYDGLLTKEQAQYYFMISTVTRNIDECDR
ncbi:hypothetical protein [Bacillus thuringiensis]|uniref:hypothetical protein n=1 Tax=Bacillus thuringiensis TaxID=1428 RepID=UPI0020D26BE1|nr:hypothetical protein [Bacillus thuringiensis]